MEKIVSLVEQLPLRERAYTNKNGEQRTFASMGFVLTDGMNTFYAELTGDSARSCPELEKNFWYIVDFTLAHRTYNASTGELVHVNDIYLNRIKIFGQ